MNHNYHVVGFAFSIRPVRKDHAPFIDSLRQEKSLNAYLNNTTPGVKTQEDWISDYLKRPGDYHFVVEKHSTLELVGLISLYNVNEDLMSAEWGRWVVVPGSLAAVESVLLILRFGFEELGLSSVVCRTLELNSRTVSFHESLGLFRRRRIIDYVNLGGESHNAVEHELSSVNWPGVKTRIETVAERLALRLEGKLVE